VPAAEPLVGPLRARLDSSAALGVPAHVTVLYPFVPPDRIDAAVTARLARVFGSVGGFDVVLDRTAWFDDRVIWLAPRDPEPFRELTRRVVAEFPEHPPYRGEFAGLMPHLTVGHGRPGADLVSAEDAVRPGLPVIDRADAVTLLVQHEPGGRWHRAQRLPLARIG